MFIKCTSRMVSFYSLLNSHSSTASKRIKPALSLCGEGHSKRHAGHSKWHNIKNIKEAKDRIKGLTYGRHVMEITYACAKGSLDPRNNAKLSKALEAAHADNVPMATIKRALVRIENARKNPVATILNYKGPKGAVLFISCQTDNSSRTIGDLNKIAKKYKFTKGDKTRERSSIFHSRGIVQAKPPSTDNIMEKSLEDAIEVDAEEVEPDTENPEVLNFLCSGENLPKVRSKLEVKNYDIVHSEELYIPRAPVYVTDEEMNIFQNLLDEINELDEVQSAHINVEVADAT